MSKSSNGVHSDRTNDFRESGAECLLEIGKYLRALSGKHYDRRYAGQPPSRDVIETNLDRMTRPLKEHLDRPQWSPLMRWLARPDTKELDQRVTRIIAYVAASHILGGEQEVPIAELSAVCSIDGTPAEALEMRRLIACLGVEGALLVSGDGGFFANLRLAGDIMATFMGGADCLPYLTNETIQEARDGRRRSHRRQESRPSACGDGQASNPVIADLLRGMPVLTPRQLDAEVAKLGYVGQEEARRMICLAAYRHIMRLRRIHLEGVPADILPIKSNCLLKGETGTGKTHLVTTVFGRVLKLPTVVTDCTHFSETGYVGEDVLTIPTRLIALCGMPLAEAGIICLDEIDKIGDPGACGDQRSMVSRLGVQRSLLKLLEPGVIEVPVDLGGHPYRTRRVRVQMDNILFVGLGAFSQMDQATRRSPRIGFGNASTPGATIERPLGAADFQSAGGFLPELFGRFGLVGNLRPLSREQQTAILRDNVIRQYRHELRLEGIGLLVERSAVDALVDGAIARGTGARGLQSELATALRDGCYEAYSSDGKDRLLRIYASDGEVRWEIGRRKSGDKITTDELQDMGDVPLDHGDDAGAVLSSDSSLRRTHGG